MTEISDKPRRRFVVGKAFFALLLAFLLASVAGRIWWGWYADRQYQAVIDDIRSRGEPVSWREMAPQPIPDEQNAVEVYKRVFAMPEFQKAMALTVAPKYAMPGGLPAPPPDVNTPPKIEDEWVLVDKPNNLIKSGVGETLSVKLDDAEFRRKYPDLAAKFFELVQQPLALIRQARGMKADFKIDFTRTAIRRNLLDLSDHVHVVLMLNVAAMIAHDRGDDARAIEYLLDSHALGETMYTIPELQGQMVGVSIGTINAITIEKIAPTLKVGPNPAASPKQTRALMERMIDLRSCQSNMVRCFMAERSVGPDVVSTFDGDYKSLLQYEVPQDHPERKLPPLPLYLFRFVSGPMWKLQAAEHTQFMDWLVTQAKTGRCALPTTPPPQVYRKELGPIQKLSHCLSYMLAPSLSRVFVMQYRGVSYRRMAAASLAIRLYECEHGKRPLTLTELCPKYLPAVPEDPFDPARKGIKYLPNAKHPILYVVGEDLKDDGGRYGVKGKVADIDRYVLDMPFFLNGPEDRQQAISELAGTVATSKPAGPGGP